MDPIRRDHRLSSEQGVRAAPRVTFSGALLLAGGVTVGLMVAMSGFAFAMTMVWPG